MPAKQEFPYQRIVAQLRAAIVEGRLAPGERLNSEWSLAESYQTSRPTVRRALAVLKAEGLVTTKQGQGAFVRSAPHVRLRLTGSDYRRHRNAGMAGFNAQVIEQGQHPKQELLFVGTVAADEGVASRLGLPPGEQVVTRQRLFLIDDQPVARCDSYYPAELVVGTPLAEPTRIPGGAVRLIEDPDGPIGRTVARSADELMARMPTASEVDQLRLAAGVPVLRVLRVLRTLYDVGGVALEVQESVAAADRHEFCYEVDLR